MQEVARGVYYETAYPGVTLGAITLAHGLILVDAPPRQDDVRAWRAALMNLGGGVERLLVNLDAHFDRTLGVRGMDCTIAAHENTAEIYRNRSTTFKAQPGITGAEWEQISGLGSIRWAPPDLSFSKCLVLHWGEQTIMLEYHPGPNPGAIWVIDSDSKVIFLGDLVMPNQPPFLANANLPAWLDSLHQLISPAYQDYQMVGGRCGAITSQDIAEQITLIETIQSHLDRLREQAAPIEEIDQLVPVLLKCIDVPESRMEQYRQRLRWGLTNAYSNPTQVETQAELETEE